MNFFSKFGHENGEICVWNLVLFADNEVLRTNRVEDAGLWVLILTPMFVRSISCFGYQK